MKNILVTGGAGFIGSHTVVELVAAGYRPVIIDDFRNSDSKVLKGLEKITRQKVTFYKHDYTDQAYLENILEKEAIDGVIHFAAYKAVGESVEQPLMYYQNNVSGLVTLLQAMQNKQVTQLVFSSSCTVYGEPDTLPITEDSPLQPPASPYGATKQIAEMIIRDTSLASPKLRSLALRYFNPVGAHPSALIGELPHGVPSNLMPFIAQTVAGIRDKVTVYGDDYPTPDGSCIRDYIHVVDLAQAHVKALEYITKPTAPKFDVINIGTGHGSSVLEVIAAFESASGRKVNFEIGPRRAGDVIQIYAGVGKAKKVLGWQAAKTLTDMCRDAWQWQQTL